MTLAAAPSDVLDPVAGTADADGAEAEEPGSGREWSLRLPDAAPRVLWWITPVGGLALLVPLTLLLAVSFSNADYVFFYGTPRYVTTRDALVFAAMAAAIGLGAMLPRALDRGQTLPRPDRPDAPRWRALATAELIAFRLTMLGYVLLGAVGVARGARPSELITTLITQSNDSGRLTTLFAPVAGITSFTQVDIAQVVLAATLLSRRGRDRAVIRRLLVVLLLGMVRTFFLTERLAIIELAVPLLVIAATNAYRRGRAPAMLRAAPALALPLLVVFFGALEYSRSWTFYRATTTLSFPAFVIRRLAGYYATSYNNGAIQLLHPAAGGVPYNSLQLLWTAPGLAQLHAYTRLGGTGGPDWIGSVIQTYGNIEFNNPGGLAVPVIDFGVPGGVLYCLLVGLVVGLAYRSWRLDRTTGLLFYPMLFTGLLEIPRYVYWTEGRIFPSLVFLGVTAVLVERRHTDRAKSA